MRSPEARSQLQSTIQRSIQRTIRSFLASSAPHLILDTRPRSVYRARHIAPSTNIPREHLHQSWFQLPPKQTPFAVLQSTRESAGDKDAPPWPVSSKQEHSCHDDKDPSPQNHLQPSDLLRSRGWRPHWTFEDHPIFWSALARELSLDPSTRQGQGQGQGQEPVESPQLSIETSGHHSRSAHSARYNFLFVPNPVPVKMLPLIEHRLLQQRRQPVQTRTSPPDIGKPPSALKPWPATFFRCLDMGCGSGRGMTYMVARASNKSSNSNGLSSLNTKVQWTVLGMDQRKDACERALQLARDTFSPLQCQDQEYSQDRRRNLDLDQEQEQEEEHRHGHEQEREPDLASRVSTLVGKVDPTTGVFWASPSQASSTAGPLLLLNNIRYQDPDQDQLQQQRQQHQQQKHRLMKARACTNENDNDDRFDLIILIRFLQRPLLKPLVQHWLRPGGFVLLSTFVSDVDLPQYSKPGPAHRLQSKTEAREIFERLGLDVVLDEVSLIEDGSRSVATVLAQMPE